MTNTTMHRRKMIGMLGAAALPAVYGAEPPLVRVKLIERVSLAVSNIEAAMVFYRRLFGNNVLTDRDTGTRYLLMGPCYLEIFQTEKGEASRITRFGASVENFQVSSLKPHLVKAGIPVTESARGLTITDPDGVLFEFGPIDSWKQLQNVTAEPKIGEPLFHSKGMHHVAVHSADMKTSTDFYRKLFGSESVAQSDLRGPSFQAGGTRVGLYFPSGNKTGPDHYSVLVDEYDIPAVLEELKSLGAKAELSKDGRLTEFYAPDGIRMQVSTM